ncbi:unnamed protein product, partial [marine sediment metagenome]
PGTVRNPVKLSEPRNLSNPLPMSEPRGVRNPCHKSEPKIEIITKEREEDNDIRGKEG